MIQPTNSDKEELMKNSENCPIEAIYIFNNNGLCLVSCNLNSNKIENDMATGFFSALDDFGKNAIGGDIECIIMSGHKFFYSRYEKVTFVIQCCKDLPDQVAQHILNEIANNFLLTYREIYETWDGGDLSIFDDFKKYLRTYLENSLIEKILHTFGYKFHAEGIIVYDELKDEIIFSKLPKEYGSQYHKSMGGIAINFAKNLSEKFEAGIVNSVLIFADKKWICISKMKHLYITAIFPKINEVEVDLIIKKTEETLRDILLTLNI
ncbi:MAG: hypothetical protein ACTSQY_04095 [Candidatus Odinarchaeia archaeon]